MRRTGLQARLSRSHTGTLPCGFLIALLGVGSGCEPKRTGETVCARVMGGMTSDAPFSVAMDSTGSSIVTAASAGTADYGGGPLQTSSSVQLILAKYTSECEHVFSRGFAGMAPNHRIFGNGFVLPDDEIALVGTIFGTVEVGGMSITGQAVNTAQKDLFFAHYGGDGSLRSARRLGGPVEDSSPQRAVDRNGNLFIAGEFIGTVNPAGASFTSRGRTDVYIAAYAPDGTPRWSKQLGAVGEEEVFSLATDRDGNVFVSGHFEGTVDFGAGPVTATGPEPDNTFIAKYTVDGGLAWLKHYGPQRMDSSLGVSYLAMATDSEGAVVLAGQAAGPVDVGGGPQDGFVDDIIVKYAADGEFRWVRRLPKMDIAPFRSMAIDDDDDIVVTRETLAGADVDLGTGILTGDPYDVIVAKFSSSGESLWARRFGQGALAFGMGAAAGPDGKSAFVGRFDTTIDFGTGVLTSQPDYDVFLLRLSR